MKGLLLLGAWMLLAIMQPAHAVAAERVVFIAVDSPFANAIRLAEPQGGPSLRETVPPDIADRVFTSKSDSMPANAWFTRTYKAALKTNEMLAKSPEQARFELSANVVSVRIVPLATGARNTSEVTFRLNNVANGKLVWERTIVFKSDIQRGIRFGGAGRALGAALGGALSGQNSAVTAAQISAINSQVRPMDIRIDVYEGIMRGFQRMAEETVRDIASLPLSG